jgi:hypothetical protein
MIAGAGAVLLAVGMAFVATPLVTPVAHADYTDPNCVHPISALVAQDCQRVAQDQQQQDQQQAKCDWAKNIPGVGADYMAWAECEAGMSPQTLGDYQQQQQQKQDNAQCHRLYGADPNHNCSTE